MKTEKQLKQETLEEAAEKFYPPKTTDLICSPKLVRDSFIAGAKWQQEQEQNNENSWFNEYQKVEDYIIKRIGDKFLEATPEKYNTASEATIALLENNWQQEQNKNLYSEEESIQKIIDYVDFQFNTNGELNSEIKKWFEQFKKK